MRERSLGSELAFDQSSGSRFSHASPATPAPFSANTVSRLWDREGDGDGGGFREMRERIGDGGGEREMERERERGQDDDETGGKR